MIRFENVSFHYGGEHGTGDGVDGINLSVGDGEVVVLCGESGCGKTTLTRLINGLAPNFYEGVLEGSVYVGDLNVSTASLAETARRVGSVFQNPKSQFFNVDTTGELAFGCENRGMPRDEIRERVNKVCTEMKLDALMNRNIFELSGGEKQQIACGSVYATDPDVYVLDEPSSNLDKKAIVRLHDNLMRIRKSGRTIVISEHRLYYLTDLADRFVYLKDGRIAKEFTADEMRALSDAELGALGLRCTDLGMLGEGGVSAAGGSISLKNAHNRQSSTERLSGAVLEYIEGMQVVRSFPSPGWAHNGKDNAHGSGRIRAAFADNAKTNLDFEAFFTPWQTALMVLYGAGMAATLAVSVQLYSEGALTAASLTGVTLFLFRIYAPLMHLYQQGTTLMIMSVCLDRIRSVFEEETIPDDGKEILTPAEETSKDIPEIRFENVSFSYDKEEVLHGITFEAMRGETVALCGPSGSGKTTIANLFARFFDVSSGTVFFRGKDIRKLPVETLMSGISMVFQKVYLFEDTVFNNIAMGRSDATLEEVKEAARRARCYDFIMKLPYGFDTVIGEGGAALSGGEAQRISIARCILKDAPVVILDEATASIDADNEHHIQAALSDLCRDKTVLVIAHRLNTIRGADRILVIDHGRIAESGTHESLLMEGGLYARMVDSADAREEKS